MKYTYQLMYKIYVCVRFIYKYNILIELLVVVELKYTVVADEEQHHEV